MDDLGVPLFSETSMYVLSIGGLKHTTNPRSERIQRDIFSWVISCSDVTPIFSWVWYSKESSCLNSFIKIQRLEVISWWKMKFSKDPLDLCGSEDVDADGSGSISQREYLRCLRQLGRNTTSGTGGLVLPESLAWNVKGYLWKFIIKVWMTWDLQQG